METFLGVLGFVLVVVILLLLGYGLFTGAGTPWRYHTGRVKGSGKQPWRQSRPQPGTAPPPDSGPGLVRGAEARYCPVCSARLEHGEQVKSAVYPGDPQLGRLVHVKGCVYCLEGLRKRRCPVCGAVLRDGEYLIARMFDQPGRSHVHVLGCSQCRVG
ncbi:MAG: hypothetical protein LBT11_04710 [Treponema sp.]|nr:hypothetical protein [Treponema sp.]